VVVKITSRFKMVLWEATIVENGNDASASPVGRSANIKAESETILDSFQEYSSLNDTQRALDR